MRYLLDTNIVSLLLKNHPAIRERVLQLPLGALAISSVTLGELEFGLAKRGQPQALRRLVHNFLQHVDVLPWVAETAQHYGELRARCQAQGVTLGALDMMIAAQAQASERVLVSNDRAFSHIPGHFALENWMTP